MKKLLFSIFLIMMMIGGTASYAVNAPVLADGMTPVKWDSSSGDWVETNTTDADWYNYEQVPSTSSTIAGNGTGKWANAITADGSMWVWIPRYTYKIVSGYHKSGNSFSNDTAGTNEIAIKWSNGTTDDNSSSYLSHPAFTLNGEELTGFWVAKVEATDSSSFLLGKNILVAIWPTAYDKVKNIQNGHLIRNSEWGAVAYLTNAIGRIPFGELDNGVAGMLNGYDWNTEAGVKGSTTHNVYGVYGMNGGANEWVAGVLGNGSLENVDFYTSAYSSANKGDAVYETSDESGNTWDGGTYTGSGSNLAFTRGADSIFSFNGCKMDREMGYRAVISIPVTTYTVVFNPNYSGATATNLQSFVAGTAQNLATNAFTRDGYIFKEWNTKADGTGTSYTDGASYTATADITLYAQWTPVDYTITYNLDGGTVSGTNPTTYTTTSSAITLVNPTKEGYTFLGWTGSNGTTPSTTVTIPKGSTGDREYTANWEEAVTPANAPVLTTGLTPVNWNGTSWETTTVANWNYNYNSVATATHSTVAGNGNGKWANAQTADGSLYVWIPRYSYKITSGEHAASQKSWNSLTAAGTAKIEVKFSNGTTDDTSNSYIAHPAFTFGTDELEGIWVAKYEASQGSTTNETSVPTSSTSVAKSIPGVASWRNITVSNMFDYAYNTYRNADSHLMKNVEWGAVAYLTNAIGRIPYINNSSDYITGNAGGSQDASEAAGTTNAWNTAGGVKASTTHNVYGIYDMSGGAWEYVAAYVNNGNSILSTYASSLVNAATKYKDVYPIGSSDSRANNYAAWSSIKGDAVYETSSSGSSSSGSWDGDCSNAPGSKYPVFRRGGGCSNYSSAGVFCFSYVNGNAGSNSGFRVVLAPNKKYTITYNLDGGTVTGNPATYTSNDIITLNNPTKEGYTFTGWTGTGLTEATTTVTIAKGSTGDREYTANWEEEISSYNLIVNNGIASSEGPVSSRETITITAAPNTGYRFVNWTVNGITLTDAQKTSATISFAMPTNDVTVTANFELMTYTVSYDANGGTNAPASQTKTHGVDLTLTSDIPTNTGYTFAGWTTNQDGTGDNYASGAVYTVNASVTLYAKWVAGGGTGYTVYHYFENVGDTNYTLYKTENKTGTTEATITLANEKIAIDGGTYKQGSLTEGGVAVTTTTIAADGTTKIYLYYLRNTYTLTLNKNSYVDSVSGAGTYKYGASVSIDATLGSAEGYTYSFTNWTSSNTSLVPNQATKSATITMPAGDVTLTANASRTPITYTISYELDGGAVSGTNPASYTVESSTITLINPVKSGYTFVGWTGSNGTTPSITVTIPTGSIGNRFYTANWTITEYTLTINNGTTTTSENVIPGTTKTATAVIPSGKHFYGWSAVGITLTDAQRTATTISFEMPSNDVTLTAVLDDNIRVIWTWNATDDLTKTISLKTTGQSTIDWGDGEVSNIISSTSKFTLSHTYATAGNYNVVMDGDKVTYLDISDKKVTAFTTEGAVALNELFIYNNEFTTLALGTVNKVVTDSNVQTTGTVSKLLRVGVNGTVQNPYNASALTGTNTVIATFDVKSDIGDLNGEITWNWTITSSLTRTVTATVSSDTVILWGDGNYDVVLAGSARTISHTYASTGNYTAGFLDSAVTSISIPNSNVTSINVAKGTTLEKLNVSRNVLSYIDLKTNKALKEFYASYNNFTTVDLTNNTSLEKVELAGNKISVMNLATSAPITLLDVGGNRLSSLDVSNFALLETLRCYDNGISTLNLGTIANLKVLDISNNALTSVNVSYNTKLEELYCNYNELTSLDVSKNTLLKILKCENNKITSLNVTNAAELTEIRTFNNAITTLNLLNNSKLDFAIVDLDCTVSLNDATENILRLKAKEHGYIDAYDYVTGRFIPETGYRVESVKLNDIEQGSITSLTLSSCIGDNTLIATFVLDDSQGTQVVINMPNILDGMIPVKWNGTAWVITVQGDLEWYDYSSSNMKWANVMLRDGAKYMEGDVSTDVSNKALSELNGKIVDSNNMGSMFVWIPRFSYLVEGSNISVKFSNGLIDDTSDGYILHPAFNFSSYNGGDTSSSLNYEPQLSESDKLLGFWVAKYPASNNNGKVASKDATEWTNISINNAFVNSKNMFGSNLSSYGISVNSDVTIYDSHLMKNVEWGATAYLAAALGNIGTSTTGNETGVYGMNSGKEFVASYIELVGGISNYSVRANGVNLLTYAIDGYTPDAEVSRYIDKVKLVSPDDTQANNRARLDDYYGTATTETNGSASVPYKVNAFFVRGENGIFDYSGSDGSASSTISFRPTIFAEVLSSSITTHQITSATNAYGRISPLGTVTVMDGGSQKYLLTPNDGAEIVDVLVDGISVLSELTEVTATTKAYIFTNVTSNHTINVIFDLPVAPYTVTATVQPENAGTVEGVGTHNSRSTVTLTAVPNAGYVFESWTVIGNSVTLGNLTSATISFTMPSNNVTLQANFKEGQYALLKVEMSDVSFESMEAVGKTIEVSAVTETGYVFSKWEATGITLTEEQKVSANITFVMPANAVTLIASYTEQTVASQYTIEVIQTANGTITPGTTLVNSGANQTFNIAPNTGYVLSELIVDGNAVTTASSYTFENVTSNHTITATFSPIRYTISYNLDGGTVSGNPTSYTVEDAITLVNPTKDGYNFTGWTGTELSSATTTVIIPKGSTGNRIYTANWELANVAPTTPTVTLSSKTTSSFVVKAVSTDSDGDNLIYKLYVDGILKSTSASTKSGTATTFTVTGLGEYTSHNYYVTVSDGTDTAQSSTASVRTYCSGTTYSNCNGVEQPGCSTCKGYGGSGCSGGFEETYLYTETCSKCGSTNKNKYEYECSDGCGFIYWGYSKCSAGCKNNVIFIPICGGQHSCSNEDDVLEIHTKYGGDRCSVCGGDGKLDGYVCSSHNNVNLTSKSQNHCAHGKTSQHD